jgi:tetratricopeptide (TPR) repeat protein
VAIGCEMRTCRLDLRRRATAALLVIVAAGCAHQAPRVGVEPKLDDELQKLTPAEQLARLRPLAKAQPGDSEIHFLTGNAYYQWATGFGEGEQPQAVAYYDSAIGEYNRVVKLDSTISKAWVNMGLAYEGENKSPDARRVFQKAIAVNPRDVLAYCHLGYLEQQDGRVDHAVDMYQKAIAIDPNSAQAHYDLGLAFADAKIFREALIEWETVVRLDPKGDLGKTAGDNVRIIRQYLDTSSP